MATTTAVTNFRVDGLVCAPCTPFDKYGELNLTMIPPYVQHLLDYDCYNVFVCGSVGEGLHMTVNERKLVAESWVKAGNGRLKTIIMHIGAGNLKESQELAGHAQNIGCGAIACVGPTYFKPETLEEYVEYTQQVAGAAPMLPFYLYDIDFVTGIKFNTNAFFHLAKDRIPTLVGVKHTTPNLPTMQSILHDHGNRFQVLLGSDELYLAGLAVGVEGNVVSSFFVPTLIRCKAAFDKGDMHKAREEQARVLKASEARNKRGFWGPAMAKSVLRILGLDMGQPRLPLSPMPEENITALKNDLATMGFFDWGKN